MILTESLKRLVLEYWFLLMIGISKGLEIRGDGPLVINIARSGFLGGS